MNDKSVVADLTVNTRALFVVLGPGILYAAAAVGISHLIQATRAGANYGLGLFLVIIFACVIKYPALRFGSDYAAATGKSLISSYRAEGWWAFGLYALAQLFSMVFIVAAIAIFTLGLFQTALGFSVNPLLGVSVLLFIVATFLMTGHYYWLEKLSKYVVAIFTVLILVAVVLVGVQMEWSLAAFVLPEVNSNVVLFIAALIGFMPTPIDGAVLQSLWSCTRKESGYVASPKEARLDFNVGYIISVFLGLCFLVLGAGVMHSAGVPIVSTNGGFSRQLLELFTRTIGDWSFPLIATAVIFVMLSTLFTVVDGMTRIVMGILEQTFASGEAAGIHSDNRPGTISATISATVPATARRYNMIVVLLCFSALLVLATMMKSFATFIDITAVIVFVISPILAYLNHRSMWSDRVPKEQQPGPAMKVWSLIAVTILLLLTLVYFWFRLFV